jgi:hypothetical protein
MRTFTRWNPTDAALESDYREGFLIADAEFGVETRPWDRVLHGIANVLRKRGIQIDYMKIAEIWHYPTASMDDKISAADVFRQMDSALWEDKKRYEYYKYSDRHFDHLFSMAHMHRSYHPGELDFDKAVDDLIDREIKRTYPKIRRGTKKYAELYGQVFKQAQKIVSDEVANVKERERQDLSKLYERDIIPALKGINERVRWLRMRAGHVSAVLGTTPNVLGALAEADRLEKKAADLNDYWKNIMSRGSRDEGVHREVEIQDRRGA